jgi:hypothetical protein
MKLNSRSSHVSTDNDSSLQITDKSFFPHNYVDPELNLFMEFGFSPSSSSSSSTHELLYLVSGLAILIFAGLGLWVQCSQHQYRAQQIQDLVMFQASSQFFRE